MSDKLDDILKHVLTPQETPGECLNRKIVNQVKEEKIMSNNKRKKGVLAASAAAAVVLATSVSVYAAYHFLSASDVAGTLGDDKLAESFQSQEGTGAWETTSTDESSDLAYDTQTGGDYEVTLLGMLSGENLSQFQSMTNGEIRSDRTYCAVAIRRTDGKPVDDEHEEFFVSPLVGSLNPSQYNAAGMCGNYGQYVEDGVLYRLLECDNIEYFADQKLYVCVTDTTFYNTDLYDWDEEAGVITRNTEYQGLNVLFDIRLDASKADAQKARQLLDDLDRMDEEDGASGPEADAQIRPEAADEALAFAETLTPENIDELCVRLENTVQTVTPDEKGWISFEPWLANENVSDTAGGGGSEGNVKYFLEEGQQGLRVDGYNCSERGMEDLLIQTYTKNEDGSVTFAVYVPKDVSIFLQNP